MSENKERCETCRFWRMFDGPPLFERGWCRRYPPVPMPWVVDDDEEHTDQGEWDETQWEPHSYSQPVTCKDEWCGEYQLRADSQNG